MADRTGSAMQAHERTYDGFLRLLKYGSVASFVIAAIVVLIIS